MKASELRIGNYVGFELEDYYPSCEIITIGPRFVSTTFIEEVEDGLGKHQTDVDLAYIHPIPITEEWLLKFGFEKDRNSDLDSYLKDRFVIEQGISQYFDKSYSFRITIDNKNSCHANSINYVHSLQNLYYALSGIELVLMK